MRGFLRQISVYVLKASPGGSCRRRKAVTDEGKTGTDFIDIFHILLPG